ncbi:hypothetical protein JCM8547_005921 [Rhodosporidiobolus lusitaniae]
MDAYLVSTKPAFSPADAPIKPAKRKPKPNSSLATALARSPDKRTGTRDSIARVNSAIRNTLGREDNPVTNSTAYSRSLHVVSCATGHQSGGGPSGSSNWAKSRNQKLRAQAQVAETQTLKGVTAYVSGYTGRHITNLQLKALVELQGGVMRPMESAGATHAFVAYNLSGSKTQKALEGKKKNGRKLVTPEWAIECARRGRKVAEERFRSPIFDESQDSTYSYLTRPTSSTSSSSASSSSSSSISPPLSSSSRSTPPPFLPSGSSSSSSSSSSYTPPPRLAFLLAQIDSSLSRAKEDADALPPSPERKRGRQHPANFESARDIWGTQREEVGVEVEEEGKDEDEEEGGGKERRKKEDWEEVQVVVLGSSDVEVEGGAKAEEDGDGLDEWEMPRSAQRR